MTANCPACGRPTMAGDVLTTIPELPNMPGRVDVWHRFCLDVVSDHSISPADAARMLCAGRQEA